MFPIDVSHTDVSLSLPFSLNSMKYPQVRIKNKRKIFKSRAKFGEKETPSQ